MGAPDTSRIDLDPARFRCRADLVVCLQQLHNDVGCPSYRDLEEIGKSMGIKLPRATIGNLIGEKSKTNPNKLAWKTVELFLRVCNVPEAGLGRWRTAWEAAMESEMPAWPEERQHLLAEIDQLRAALAASEARIDQLAADVRKAEARAVDCEKALAGRDQTQSVEPSQPNYHLEILCRKAKARRDIGDYEGAEQLYEQIANQLEYKLGPGDRRTLRFKSLHLDAKTCKYFCSLSPDAYVSFGPGGSPTGRRLNTSWEELVCEHQRRLPEGDPMTLRLQLRYADWADTMRSHTLADRILMDLCVDCEAFSRVTDPLYDEILQRLKNGFPTRNKARRRTKNGFFSAGAQRPFSAGTQRPFSAGTQRTQEPPDTISFFDGCAPVSLSMWSSTKPLSASNLHSQAILLLEKALRS